MSKSSVQTDQPEPLQYRQITSNIEVPQGWELSRTDGGGTFGGYAIVGELKREDERQGYLLSDSDYKRICCVLMPSTDTFYDARICASSKINQSTDLVAAGEKISHEISLCDEQL